MGDSRKQRGGRQCTWRQDPLTQKRKRREINNIDIHKGKEPRRGKKRKPERLRGTEGTSSDVLWEGNLDKRALGAETED